MSCGGGAAAAARANGCGGRGGAGCLPQAADNRVRDPSMKEIRVTISQEDGVISVRACMRPAQI